MIPTLSQTFDVEYNGAYGTAKKPLKVERESIFLSVHQNQPRAYATLTVSMIFPLKPPIID